MLSDADIETTCMVIESRFEKISTAEIAADGPPPDVLYHYTSAEGLHGIVESRAILATNVLYLNDTSELSDGWRLLTSELESRPLRLREKARDYFMCIQQYSEDIPLDHFVTSFCQDGDLLSQWRGYGAPGTGYSIGFQASALQCAAKREENNLRGACTLRKVQYSLDRKKEMIRTRIGVLNEILEPIANELEPPSDEEVRGLEPLLQRITASFRATMALMKHAAFKEEQEWRLVRTLWQKRVPTSYWPVKVRPIRGKLIPYVPISWAVPNTSASEEVCGISGVYCGPSVVPELQEKVVRDFLAGHKCWTARNHVVRSGVPLRT
jgi:hypothetical protein